LAEIVGSGTTSVTTALFATVTPITVAVDALLTAIDVIEVKFSVVGGGISRSERTASVLDSIVAVRGGENGDLSNRLFDKSALGVGDGTRESSAVHALIGTAAVGHVDGDRITRELAVTNPDILVFGSSRFIGISLATVTRIPVGINEVLSAIQCAHTPARSTFNTIATKAEISESILIVVTSQVTTFIETVSRNNLAIFVVNCTSGFNRLLNCPVIAVPAGVQKGMAVKVEGNGVIGCYRSAQVVLVCNIVEGDSVNFGFKLSVGIVVGWNASVNPDPLEEDAHGISSSG